MPLVETLRYALDQLPDVRLAVLFGSAARGALRPGSDLDVGVILEPGAGLSPSLTATLERATARQVDMLLLDDASPLLRFEIAKHGMLLLERRPGDWNQFRARALVDWWDWAPTERAMNRVMVRRLKEEAARG